MPGTFVFRPIEANLTHDTDWLGKMDPYCAYMMNNKRIKGQVCKSGGQHPVWNEATTVPSEIDQPACVVELMDKDTFIDDSIGTFVVDLNEVRNYGTVSKWYPVFHKNKPAGQILFEAAYQPAQQNIQVIQPVIHETVFVEEVPKKAIIEETVIQKEVLPQETFAQSSFISKGGVIPVGSTNLDGGLYGKVVHAQPVSHLPNQQLSGTGVYQDTLTRTELGGPLSGSLGGGVLGTRELTGQGFIGTATTHQESIGTTRRVVDTQVTESQYVTSQTVGNQLSGTGITQTYGNQNFGSQGLGNQGLLNQNAINQGMGQNLPINFNSTSVSNAQLGGGAPLYQETANHPTAKPTTAKSHLKGANKGEIVDPDLIGGHTQTNQNYGNQF